MNDPVNDPVQRGDPVRIYYDQDTFDEGFVRAVGEFIEVDFYDWIERWPLTGRFTRQHSFLEGVSVLVPLEQGEIIQDFRTVAGEWDGLLEEQ